MHLLTVLVVTSAALGRELTWPGDCEIKRVSDGWMQAPLHETLLISFFLVTSECEVNLNIISKTSGNCILTDRWIRGIYRSNLTCMGITAHVTNRAMNVVWRDIFVETMSDSYSPLEIMFSDSMNTVQTVKRELRPPLFVNLSISGGADVVLNCPNAGCQKGDQKLIPKSESKFSSFFVRPGGSFTGVKIITEPVTYSTLLNPLQFNQSLWNQVYVTFSQSLLKVRVNGRLAEIRLVSGSSFTVQGFQVMGEGEMKWCESEDQIGDPLLALVWCLTSVELLLLILSVCFVCVYRRKLITAITTRDE